jgi:hypothetical protein
MLKETTACMSAYTMDGSRVGRYHAPHMTRDPSQVWLPSQGSTNHFPIQLSSYDLFHRDLPERAYWCDTILSGVRGQELLA